MNSTYTTLIKKSEQFGAGYLILIDPDKTDEKKLPEFIRHATDAGVDGFLVGGSLIMDNSFHHCIRTIKNNTNVPVIIFPGNVQQVSNEADAILFLSLISGRNPEYLIGSHVVAAPMIKKIGLETIPTAYLLIESGKTTSAEFMSNTKPLPRHKPDIAVAHSLAAEYLGFKMLYLEAGSGAENSVPEEIIHAISQHTSLPLIVGGGITSPEIARKKVEAGAKFIVTGNVLEKNGEKDFIKEFVSAIHKKNINGE